jgi:hypothetical protein
MEFKMDAVVLLPKRDDLWHLMMRQLPVMGSRVFPRSAEVYVDSPHVP